MQALVLGVFVNAHTVELFGAVGLADPLHKGRGLSLLTFRLLSGELFRHSMKIRPNGAVKNESEFVGRTWRGIDV